jgi:hypothetical protein
MASTTEEKHFQFWSSELKWSSDIPLNIKTNQFKKIPCIVPGCNHLVKSWIDEYCAECTTNHVLYLTEVRRLRTGKNPFDQEEDTVQYRRQNNCWDFFRCFR